MIATYMDELADALRVRGAARRRFLRECRDHLRDAAAERGEAEAVRAFGPPKELAAEFDLEVAAKRGIRATLLTAAGVLAIAGSTLALIHSAQPNATAVTLWAGVFFIAAQVSGVAAILALLQALALRHETMPPAQLALLARRNAFALGAAGLTMFAAGAALPGKGNAILLAAGPALVCVALVSVIRARALARRLEGGRTRAVRPPIPMVPMRQLLALTTVCAAIAAFLRDTAEHATASQALMTASIEAAAVVACFCALGPALGLWRRRAA
jgi:uncharacterized membrane protein